MRSCIGIGRLIGYGNIDLCKTTVNTLRAEVGDATALPMSFHFAGRVASHEFLAKVLGRLSE